MSRYGPATVTCDDALQQPGVFVLLLHKELQGLVIGKIMRSLVTRPFEEELAFAGLAELKVRKRPREKLLGRVIERAGQIPFWFRAVFFVSQIIVEPVS
jgi:hypothetical protein